MKYVDPKTAVLKDLVQPGKMVRFAYYKDNEFWYQHEDGLLFPIALSEVNDPASKATMMAEDKAMLFMRWMRKYIESAKVNSDERC